MTFKVLIVDDSNFFRRRLSEILEKDPNLEVVGFANNGKEAISQAEALSPDVITMDVEMPVLNGIEAVRQIMEKTPTPILMFSSLTHDGAKATLDALDAGALDFLPKKFDEIARDSEEAGKKLRQMVVQMARKAVMMKRRRVPSRSISSPSAAATPAASASRTLFNREAAKPSPSAGVSRSIKCSGKQYKLLALGTSTGGPVALQKVLTAFPANYDKPIILVQHMPEAFTPAFAKRLDSLCKIKVCEAQNGDLLKPGVAYLAPGGKQMMLEGSENACKLKIFEDDSAKITYRPSVDITFGSSARVFGGKVLAVVLTGMGADGREGARLLKGRGATIWSQDEQSCVVYGMPQAVENAGLSQSVLPLDEIADAILKESFKS